MGDPQGYELPVRAMAGAPAVVAFCLRFMQNSWADHPEPVGARLGGATDDGSEGLLLVVAGQWFSFDLLHLLMLIDVCVRVGMPDELVSALRESIKHLGERRPVN